MYRTHVENKISGSFKGDSISLHTKESLYKTNNKVNRHKRIKKKDN